MDKAAKPRPRVVIVGCGFGGLAAARRLEHADVELVVVDRNNYHLFQPLLYQVAAAALTPANIAQPIRRILHGKHTIVMLGEVDSISLDQRNVCVDAQHIRYDYLVLAPGSVDNYFGHDDWRQYAIGMKDIEDAVRIRSRMLLSFEAAELEGDATRRGAHLTFVIIGAGPTGVELAGAIKELAVDVLAKDFHFLDARTVRVVLVEAGERLLPALHPDSSRRALEQLQTLGVEVRLGQRVTQVFDDGVEAGGERIDSCNVIWAAGVRASPLVEMLGAELGPGRRARVASDCSLPGHPEVFVIGDSALLTDKRHQRPVPAVSQGAIQMGKYVARIIRDEVRRGRSAWRERGFRYTDWGSMATIGKSRAVVELHNLRFGGFPAWIAWLTLHITVLIGFRSRLAVLAEWIYNYVFKRRGSRLITGMEQGEIKDLTLASVDQRRR